MSNLKHNLQNMIQETITHEGEPCVSIYTPLEENPAEHRANRTRLKNRIKEAKASLEKYGEGYDKDMFEPADSLLDADDFWVRPERGLAVFVRKNYFRAQPLPLPPVESSFVERRFNIKPLLPMLAFNDGFFLLAVSQNRVRFWEATRFDMSERRLENVPQGLEEALALEEEERSVQFHTGTGGTGGGERPGVFHGQGAPSDNQKDQIRRYFDLIDRGLQPVLSNRSEPLLFAGVDYLFPIYREANTYSGLLERSVETAIDTIHEDDIHQRAWQEIEPRFMKQYEDETQRYRDLRHTEKTSEDIKEIAAASHFQRVDTLFVDVEKQAWGRLNDSNGAIDLIDESDKNAEDLLNLSAIHTIKNGGRVYGVSNERMPVDQPAAAVMRY